MLSLRAFIKAQPFVLRRAMSSPAKRGIIAAAEGGRTSDIQTSNKRHKTVAAQSTVKTNGKAKPKSTSSQNNPNSGAAPAVDIEDCVLPPGDQIEFRISLLAWYDVHRRRLPWRGDPPPYVASLAYRTQATNSAATGAASTSTGGRGVGSASEALSLGKKATPGSKASSTQAASQANQRSLLSFFSAKAATQAVTSSPAPVDTTAAECAFEEPSFQSATTTSKPPSPPSSSLISEAAAEEVTTAGAASIDSTGATREAAPEVSAYGTWVCEVMSQQTRIETVVDYWTKWMVQFPTVAALAAATPEEVTPTI